MAGYFGNLAADGSTNSVQLHDGDSIYTDGRWVEFAATGDFGTGTLTLEVSYDGINWVPTSVALTAAGYGAINSNALYIRGTLASSSAPDLNVWWG